MSSASTAERPTGASHVADAVRDLDADGPVVTPRFSAAGAAEEDPFRWRGLGGPRPAVPGPSPAHASAAEDLYPWRGLHPGSAEDGPPDRAALDDPRATGAARWGSGGG